MKKFDVEKNTIYVDMDGVIADFDKFLLERMGRTFPHNIGPTEDVLMWDFLQNVERLYWHLPPTEYAFELMDMVHSVGANVEILTAIPRRTAIVGAEQDKREWMAKYFGDKIKVNIGPFSKDKWKHAKQGDILIDDRPDNIEEWHGAEGIGILHLYDNFENTKNKLKEHVNF